MNPKSIKVASLLVKEKSKELCDYYGYVIENKFVVGYGMDIDNLFRNLNDIYIKDDLNNKFSLINSFSNSESANRLKLMGEEEKNIVVSGNPSIDIINKINLEEKSPLENFLKEFSFFSLNLVSM